MKMKHLLTFSLLFIAGLSLNAAESLFVQGDVLVKILPNASIDVVVNKANEQQGNQIQLRVKKVVAKSLHIWQLQFDQTVVSHEELLRALENMPEVLIAQNNHIIEKRQTTPNDPEFSNQWQYINDGSNGGVVGADIDADLAWNITTGGTTTQGDEIVVCVIDDGVDRDHGDLASRLWFNTAEVPNNGIDDDNNGFVDDYEGWNSYSDTDDIEGSFFEDHGTPVCGIVGAAGNDDFGVTGVNWNVKIMMVVGGGDEAQALAAYAYPYEQRLIYNETNGEAGAFVVATNASWGIDGGQPSEAPLWCNFYNDLGEIGILNAGATINGNQNVDTFGDLPTACPSDYMISVTNMNRQDQKVTQAGYGLETIDLGAFGQDTWTVAYGGGFDGFGGTSGATPHVAGAIGLFYAAPCNGLIEFAKADPAGAALLVRDYLLMGVDANASLDGITVTGGRLNVFNSLNLIMGNCSENDCPNPYNFTLGDIVGGLASISWETFDPVGTFSVNLVSNNGDTIMTESTTNNFIALDIVNMLGFCVDYQLLVQSDCDTIQSETIVYDFTTQGCCENPEDLMVVNATENTVGVSWTSMAVANDYLIRISELGQGNWVEYMTGDVAAFEIPSLMPCTAYEVQIQSLCGDLFVDYSESIVVSTFGCGACTDLAYCELSAENSSEEYIDIVEINGYVNASGGGDGYVLYEATGINLNIGCDYDMTLTPGYPAQSFNEVFDVWIDFNQNGVFDDEEKVMDTEPIQNPITASINVPTDALAGSTRMRVSMQWTNQQEDASCGSFEYGEVEDYCVELLADTGGGAFTIALADDEITTCSGDVVLLNPIATGNANYSWSPSTGLSDPNSLATQATPNQTTTYTLSATGTTDCESTTLTETVTIVVVESPSSDVILEELIIICSGDEGSLNAVAIIDATYQWEPASAVSDASSTNPVITDNSVTEFTLTVNTMVEGCMFSLTDQINMEAIAEFNVAAQLKEDGVDCDNNELTLEAGSEDMDDLSYTWTTTDGAIVGAANTETIVVNAVGTYQVMGATANGCARENTIIIESLPLIEAFEFEVDGDNLTLTNEYDSYQWRKDGTPINGATASTYEVIESGDYAVSVTNSFGCERTSDVQNITFSALEDIAQIGMTIYPNPVSDYLNIDLGSKQETTVVEVIGIDGKILLQKEVSNQSYLQLDVATLNSGMYFIKIQTGDQEYVRSFVK